MFVLFFNHSKISSFGCANFGFVSRGQNNIQGLKITEKWTHCLFSAVTFLNGGPISSRRCKSSVPKSTFLLNTLILKVHLVSSEIYTGKNNRFPFLDIFGYLKSTHKNPKFGRVRQVPIWELGWEFPGWDLSHFAKFGIFMGIL